jgi:hypothetical protein
MRAAPTDSWPVAACACWRGRSGGTLRLARTQGDTRARRNPQFKGTKVTLEPHLLHDFGEDEFYGTELRLIVLGYLRGEWDFTTIEALKEVIREDIRRTNAALDETPSLDALAADDFFAPCHVAAEKE